jgi:hypothetical protein
MVTNESESNTAHKHDTKPTTVPTTPAIEPTEPTESTDSTVDIDSVALELQAYIDRISKKLIVEIPKAIRESNAQYVDLIHIAGDINARLSSK